MRGVVTGGWGYVWSAYSLTATILLIYAVTLFTRLRQERR
jgi:heme exporter protein D